MLEHDPERCFWEAGHTFNSICLALLCFSQPNLFTLSWSDYHRVQILLITGCVWMTKHRLRKLAVLFRDEAGKHSIVPNMIVTIIFLV